jgi:hypothetical protein
MMKEFFLFLYVAFLGGCSFLGYSGYYKLHLSNEEKEVSKERAVVYTENDFRGVWGVVPIVPFIPYFSLSRDSVELRLFHKKMEECPMILHNTDTLAFHYHKSKEDLNCPYENVCVYEPCDIYNECHYLIPKAWIKEPFSLIYPNGATDSLYIERLSEFIYLPFGALSL